MQKQKKLGKNILITLGVIIIVGLLVVGLMSCDKIGKKDAVADSTEVVIDTLKAATTGADAPAVEVKEDVDPQIKQ